MARIKNEFHFLTGINFGDGLTFNKYTVMFDMVTLGNQSEDQEIAFERISYFMHEIVQSSVFMMESDIDNIAKYEAAGINVLTVPKPGPIDPVILAIIVTKVNSIVDGVLAIMEAEINSISGGFVTYVWDYVDEEDPIHVLVNAADSDNWWAASEPRFKSGDSSTHRIHDSWKSLHLEWVDDVLLDDIDDEIIEAEAEAEIEDSETVIIMSDFNK